VKRLKKPVVDYRAFRLNKLNDPEFSHLKLLFGWVGYFILYVITENCIPEQVCYPVHHWLDDLIPFCEIFLFPYVFWYLLVAGSLLYFALYDTVSFRKLMIYIIATQIIAMAIYILFPNRQDLRPDVFPRDNFLTRCIAFLYQIDTSTNVCPSLHVGYSLGIASVWLRKKDAAKWLKITIVVCVILICMSVTFIKQHSVVDVFAAIVMCIVVEYITFYLPKRKTAV